MNIVQLKEEEQKLRALLSENLEKQKEINASELVEKYGINIGDTVEFIEWGKQKTGIVKRIEFYDTTPYGYIVGLFNSDGKLGKKESQISKYHTDLIKVIKKASDSKE